VTKNGLHVFYTVFLKITGLALQNSGYTLSV